MPCRRRRTRFEFCSAFSQQLGLGRQKTGSKRNKGRRKKKETSTEAQSRATSRSPIGLDADLARSHGTLKVACRCPTAAHLCLPAPATQKPTLVGCTSASYKRMYPPLVHLSALHSDTSQGCLNLLHATKTIRPHRRRSFFFFFSSLPCAHFSQDSISLLLAARLWITLLFSQTLFDSPASCSGKKPSSLPICGSPKDYVTCPSKLG